MRPPKGKPDETAPVKEAEPSEPSGLIGQIEERFLANYAQVQYAFVQFFAEHVIDVSRYFGGDFEQVVILEVIGQNHLQAIIK